MTVLFAVINNGVEFWNLLNRRNIAIWLPQMGRLWSGTWLLNRPSFVSFEWQPLTVETICRSSTHFVPKCSHQFSVDLAPSNYLESLLSELLMCCICVRTQLSESYLWRGCWGNAWVVCRCWMLPYVHGLSTTFPFSVPTFSQLPPETS